MMITNDSEFEYTTNNNTCIKSCVQITCFSSKVFSTLLHLDQGAFVAQALPISQSTHDTLAQSLHLLLLSLQPETFTKQKDEAVLSGDMIDAKA